MIGFSLIQTDEAQTANSVRQNELTLYETFAKFRFILIFATSRKINTMILICFQNLKN